MRDEDVREGASSQERRTGLLRTPPKAPLNAADCPLELEAFYLVHQEVFHDWAEAHFGSRTTAEEVVHQVFTEIKVSWRDLLLAGNLEQSAWAIMRRVVNDRLAREDRPPAFIINGPVTQALRAARGKLETMHSATGLYAAIAELPQRQFQAIVLRFVLGYPAHKVAWYLGIDERTVGHHIRRGRERLRIKLDLPAEPKKGEEL